MRNNMRNKIQALGPRCDFFMRMQCNFVALLLEEEEEDIDENTEVNTKTWVRPWIYNRQNAGAFHTLFNELKLDNQAFKEYLRLDKTQFETLLQKVYTHVIKQDTNYELRVLIICARLFL